MLTMWFLIGLLAGLVAGATVMCLCVSRGRDMERSWTFKVKEQMKKEMEEGNKEKAEGMKYALEVYYSS